MSWKRNHLQFSAVFAGLRRLLAGCVWLGGVIAIQAHPNLQDAMWVKFEPHLVHLAVNVSLKEISVAQGVLPGQGGVIATATWQHAAEQHGDYLQQHLSLAAGTVPLAGKVVSVTPPPVFGEPEQTFFQYELEYPLSGSLPAEITFYQDMLKEWPYAVGTAWNVSYVVRTIKSGDNQVATWLLAHQQPLTLSTGWKPADASAPRAAQSGNWRTFRDYLWHGVWHILTGYDHLLFISALVMATMSFWEMFKVIAAFTLAHTVTLALCVLGIFHLPPFIVEPVIALSIIFVALENVFYPQRAHSRTRLAVAFGFGLIHGLGFAGGLLTAMQGLPAIGVWTALGAFSLGVETGHQMVVLPLFGLLAWSRRKPAAGIHPALLRYGSAVISCCGAYYLAVALHEQVFSR